MVIHHRQYISSPQVWAAIKAAREVYGFDFVEEALRAAEAGQRSWPYLIADPESPSGIFLVCSDLPVSRSSGSVSSSHN